MSDEHDEHPSTLIFKEYMDANLVEDAREALHNSSLLGQRIRVERCKGRKG
jgi:hypothetical protein